MTAVAKNNSIPESCLIKTPNPSSSWFIKQLEKLVEVTVPIANGKVNPAKPGWKENLKNLGMLQRIKMNELKITA